MLHIGRVSPAIDFIEENLTEKLDLDTIAKAVHYSKFHLHRIFSETAGLTIREYIQRRQLTEAARLLVCSEKPVIDIALLSGYRSQQAFTNAFTAMYKMPPSTYRGNAQFYPLQLRFSFEGSYGMLDRKRRVQWDIKFAEEDDIPCWMGLVRLVVDGFPYLDEEEYAQVLKQKIRMGQALILKDGEVAIGAMLFSFASGSIDFLGCHPLYRKMGIPKAFLDKVMGGMQKGKEISITTFREGDKADTGHRKAIKELGFAEADLLVEYGYPTQRFVM